MSEIVLAAISALAGGGLSSVLVLRYTRQKAAAEAMRAEIGVKSSELDNVEDAVKIWRETAEALREEYKANHENFSSQILALRKEIARLTRIQTKIVALLDKLTPENLERMVEQIKKEIHESNEPNA